MTMFLYIGFFLLRVSSGTSMRSISFFGSMRINYTNSMLAKKVFLCIIYTVLHQQCHSFRGTG